MLLIYALIGAIVLSMLSYGYGQVVEPRHAKLRNTGRTWTSLKLIVEVRSFLYELISSHQDPLSNLNVDQKGLQV